MSDIYLEHFGIKGMKWGIRRYQNKDGSLTPAGKRRYSKPVSEMSDQELRAAINRLQMEKQYDKLTETQVNKGRKIVSNILLNTATQTASNYISKFLTRQLNDLLENKIK